MILIVGSEGSMGKRYQAILNYLGVPFSKIDPLLGTQVSLDTRFDGVIIATPTHTHIELLHHYSRFDVPILVEKPVSMHVEEIKELPKDLDIRMMFQYQNLVSPRSRGGSYYNYFRHGNDGLIWDCMQIVALAKDMCILKETSPIWQCEINGEELSIRDMDRAYVIEVQNWLSGESHELQNLIDIHEKVADYERTTRS